MRIGAKYPNKYKAVSGHSSITNKNQMHLFVKEDETLYNQEQKTDEDVFEVMLQNKARLPIIRFDCGMGDLLIEHNRTSHKKLENSNI